MTAKRPYFKLWKKKNLTKDEKEQELVKAQIAFLAMANPKRKKENE